MRRTSPLPAVDQVLAWPGTAALALTHGRMLVLQAVRDELAEQRAAQRAAVESTASTSCPQAAPQADGCEAMARAIAERVQRLTRPSLQVVFNLTGTVLHTNLGRAPLPEAAIEAMAQVARGASNLEFDLATGRRGDRDDHIEALLLRLTGAEAATVVNNNAAALLLILSALAPRREVIVSRGELVEIGGAFRLPDIMRQAGCRLREVGTTNRTHLRDHAEAIGARTAMLLKVHASNYQIQGFTAAAPQRELAALARQHDLPFVVDLGSGALDDLARHGLPHEPTPFEALADGADLVCFSGDKLLGGPQAGLVVGRADLIARLKRHPLKRALRCDKLTLAALGAVLQLHTDPDRLAQRLPSLGLLIRPKADIAAQADRVQPLLAAWASPQAEVDTVAVHSQIGSGALPVDLLPSVAMRLRATGPKRQGGRVLLALAAALRALPRPVIGRIADGALLLDLRCLDDEAAFLRQLETAALDPPT